MAAGACSGWGALPPAWPWRRSIPRSAHPVPRWPLPASPACVSADPMLRSAPTVGPAAWWPLAPLVRSSVPLPRQSPGPLPACWSPSRWSGSTPASGETIPPARFRYMASPALGAGLALGIFARIPPDVVLNGAGAGTSNQWLAQIAGVVALVLFVLPMTYSLNWLLNRFYPQRVSAEGEAHGLDLFERGAGAYPEFVVHREDVRQR